MTKKNGKIFVQIAAYRDSELNKTVEDCINKCSDPARLTFGVCEQVMSDDERLRIWYDSTIVTVHALQSKGCCWARATCNNMYQGEEYTLQIDAHMRFQQDWDLIMEEQLLSAPSAKPIISVYPHMYWKSDDGGYDFGRTAPPISIALTRFFDDGMLTIEPKVHEFETELWRARVLAAGFMFTYGSFIDEVPYDDELYFIGEEITMSIRAWTNGWDIFHPKICPLFHWFCRDKAPRNETDNNASEHIALSVAKTLAMLRGDQIERYGFGTVRSLADYEGYAGINFKTGVISDETAQGLQPEEWEPK